MVRFLTIAVVFIQNYIIFCVANRWNFVGKNIVVTGGTKGIGKAIVEECCSLSGNVFTCARNVEELNNFLESMKLLGYRVNGIVADVSKAEDRTLLVQKASEWFNEEIHVLINNVGTNIRKSTVEYSEGDYQKIMSTNLDSAFFLSKSFYPFLKRSGKACIVNIGSVAGGNHIGIKSGVIYAMTKAAMTQMTYNMACEWASDGIRVNAVSPWYTYTPLTEKILSDRSFHDSIVQRTPIKRVANAEEVASAVAFLALDAASYVTGQSLCVDGGFSRNGNYD